MTGVKSTLKILISGGWYLLNGLAKYMRLTSAEPGLVILYYHAVRTDEIKSFEQQLDMVLAYADVVGADYSAEPDGRPKVAITFDDAFESVIDNALPALGLRKMPCTVFVPTRCLGSPPNWQMESTEKDRTEKVATAQRLQSLPETVRLEAHSQTHPRLTQVPSAVALQEINGAREDIAAITGKPAALFAFPYGDLNQEMINLCRNAGYRFAFSTQPGVVPSNAADSLRRRNAVNPSDSKLEFWLKIRGAYSWMPGASRAKRRVVAILGGKT
jgi:peptidoglycan/xylan/chitin deacetylase (PgdA/CDA1 family)